MDDMSSGVKGLSEMSLPDGRIIKLRPVSLPRVRAAENRARKELTKLDCVLICPTHLVEGVVAAPGVEIPTEPYNDDTIQNAPDDVKELYEKYKLDSKKLTPLTVAYMFTTLLLRGTDIEIPNDGWDVALEEDGMIVPTEKSERYVFYLMNELLLPPTVAQECAFRILRLSLEGADPEVVQTFEDAFQRSLQKPRRSDADGDTEGTPEG